METTNFESLPSDSAIELNNATKFSLDSTTEPMVDFERDKKDYPRSRIENFIDKHGRNIMIAVVILVCLLIGIRVASSSSSSSSNNNNNNNCDSEYKATASSCQLSKVSPPILKHAIGRDKATSIEETGAATFRGYLEFYRRNSINVKERELYQTLELKSIQWFEDIEQSASLYRKYESSYDRSCDWRNSTIAFRRMKLMADCASLEFHIEANELEKMWEIRNVTVLFDSANRGSNNSWRALDYCTVEPAGRMDFAFHKRYLCGQTMVFNCKQAKYRTDDGMSVDLWIEQLEFELNGDSDVLKRGEFSKPSQECVVVSASE